MVKTTQLSIQLKLNQNRLSCLSLQGVSELLLHGRFLCGKQLGLGLTLKPDYFLFLLLFLLAVFVADLLPAKSTFAPLLADVAAATTLVAYQHPFVPAKVVDVPDMACPAIFPA